MSDFEVEISGAGGDYRVAARSAAGDTSSVQVPFPFEPLALDRRLQTLDLALRRSAATVRRLTPVDEEPVHFVGHGALDANSGEGVLAFTGDDGGVQRVGASDLALLLAEHRAMRLVVLNSCETARAIATDRFSSTASALMRRAIPAVVAMQYEITDPAAISFARGFYSALAAQLPVDQAVTRARRAIKFARRNTPWISYWCSMSVPFAEGRFITIVTNAAGALTSTRPRRLPARPLDAATRARSCVPTAA